MATPTPFAANTFSTMETPRPAPFPDLAFTAYPSGTNPDPNYQPPNFVFGVHNSPDGIIQYTGNAFGGALNGKFLISEYSAGDDIVMLTADSNDNIIGGLLSPATGANAGLGPDRTVAGFNGFTNPVTLIENPATGYIYVSELGGSKLTLLKPETVKPTITVSAPAVAFNTIATGNAGAGISRIETVTLTNTGADCLTLGAGAFTVVNNPASATQNKADFSISNLASLPGSLAPGQSTVIQLQYTATTVATASGIQSALLQITSAGASTPTVNVTLNGIGTAGQFGYDEPSLVQVLRANDIPTIVGAGPNDVNANTPTYPENPDPSSQEVAMQEMVVADPGPVTITPLAGFNPNTSPSLRFGYYASGNPSNATELFTFAQTDSQTVNPTALGATSFNPGSSPFGLYNIYPGTPVSGGGPDIHYTEDALNAPLDPVNPRKFRFFPMETPSGAVVPNTFIVATEGYNGTTYNGFVGFVGIISNVKPAPNAAGAPADRSGESDRRVIGVEPRVHPHPDSQYDRCRHRSRFQHDQDQQQRNRLADDFQPHALGYDRLDAGQSAEHADVHPRRRIAERDHQVHRDHRSFPYDHSERNQRHGHDQRLVGRQRRRRLQHRQ